MVGKPNHVIEPRRIEVEWTLTSEVNPRWLQVRSLLFSKHFSQQGLKYEQVHNKKTEK
jgi:hypothetical protein